MKTFTATLLLALALAASSSAASTARTYGLKASMTAHQVVTPKDKRWKPPTGVANARGSFVGSLTMNGNHRTLTWHLTYSHTGSSSLQLADIHFGKPGRFGRVLVRLCGPCKSGQHGTKKMSAPTARAISSGDAWVTVITTKYPNGVVRGQIRVGAK